MGKTKIGGAALMLTLALTAVAYPRQDGEKPSKPSEHRFGQKLSARGISNFAQVTPTLYRGAQPSDEGIEALKKLGVDILVDLRGSASRQEEAAASRLGMKYISIPSHCPFPRDEPLARFLTVVRDNPGKKVFVHCRLGDDRTGIAVASYRMAMEGWNAKEAFDEMETFGFRGIHHVICPGLEDYEKSFPQRLRNNKAFEQVRPEAGASGKTE